MRSDHRQEWYEYHLCDLKGQMQRTLDVERGGQVIDSADPDIGGSGTITVVLSPDDAIDWDRAMVRVWYRTTGGAWDKPLLTGYPRISRSTVAAESVQVQVDIYDTTDALRTYYLPRIFGVAAGTPIVTRVRELITEAAPLLEVVLPESGTVLAEGMTWPANTPWLTIVNTLLKAAAIDSLRSDGMGTLRADPLTPGAEKPITWQHRNDVTSLIAPGATREASDAAPNRLYCYRSTSNGDPPDIAVITIADPSNPLSFEQRGRWVTEDMRDVVAPDFATLQTIGRAELDKRIQRASAFAFDHPVLPYHSRDAITFMHTRMPLAAPLVTRSVAGKNRFSNPYFKGSEMPTGGRFSAEWGEGTAMCMRVPENPNQLVRSDIGWAPGYIGTQPVDKMLACEGATWAHRGGSANWPEMTLYAYQQALARGYGALEISMGRTSDGVWVGLHDADIDRVAGLTGGHDVRQMTWAQLSQYQVIIGASGAPQPFMRWEQLRDILPPHTVLIIDPKVSMDYADEFLARFRDEWGSDKCVAKFFGQGGGATNFATKARGYGMKTWGYFYRAQVADGTMARDQWAWDLLGMEWNAPQADWDYTLGFGKPVIAHIVPSLSAYNVAMDRGATGAQVADVAGVPAVQDWM